MDNIERFNLLTAYLFADLYLKFPIARAMASDAIIRDVPDCFPGNDSKEHGRFIGQTLLWLVETGYFIRRSQGSSAEYVLSPKSFEVLNALPSALAHKRPLPNEKTFGERLLEATQGLSRDFVHDARKQVASELVKQIIGYGIRTMSGV
jgi:hypothetical protein